MRPNRPWVGTRLASTEGWSVGMRDSEPDLSRRLVVGGVAAGLVTAAVAPASAQGTKEAASRPPTKSMVNPVNEYPRPPFPKQQQPWPGLAGRMDPRPDHGEKSYKGS